MYIVLSKIRNKCHSEGLVLTKRQIFNYLMILMFLNGFHYEPKYQTFAALVLMVHGELFLFLALIISFDNVIIIG